MTINNFRKMDLIILTALAAIIEIVYVCLIRFTNLINVNVHIPLSAVLLLIIYVRWGKLGLISTTIIFILKLLLRFQFDYLNVLSLLFNTFGVAIVLPFYKKERNVLHDKIGNTVVYGLFGYIAAIIVPFFLHLFLIKDGFVPYLIANFVNMGVGIGILMIACKQDNFLLDMEYYLKNKNKEE